MLTIFHDKPVRDDFAMGKTPFHYSKFNTKIMFGIEIKNF